MPSNNRFLTVPTLVVGALLVACGGGGGGGDDGIDSANIYTPQNAAEVLAPMLSVASGGTAASSSSARFAPARVKSSPTAVRAKSMKPAGVVEDPCNNGGSQEYEDFQNREINSPYTENNFSGTTVISDECRNTGQGEGYVWNDFEDGLYEYGYDVQNESIQFYREDDYKYRYREEEGSDYFWSYDGDGHIYSDYSEYAESIDMNFEITENDTTLSAFLGTSEEDFVIVDSPSSLFLDGVFGLESSDFPGCSMGRARVYTPEPLTYSGPYLVGVVELSAGGDDVEITLNSDGSADISVNGGAPVSLTAEQVAAARNACPEL